MLRLRYAGAFGASFALGSAINKFVTSKWLPGQQPLRFEYSELLSTLEKVVLRAEEFMELIDSEEVEECENGEE